MTFKEGIKRVVEFIGTDGLLHVLCSVLIVEVVGIFAPVWVAVLIGILVGIGKELLDKYTGRGCAEWRDVICDTIGVVLGMVLILLLRL